MRDALALLLFTRYVSEHFGKRKKSTKIKIEEKSKSIPNAFKYEKQISSSCCSLN